MYYQHLGDDSVKVFLLRTVTPLLCTTFAKNFRIFKKNIYFYHYLLKSIVKICCGFLCFAEWMDRESAGKKLMADLSMWDFPIHESEL